MVFRFAVMQGVRAMSRHLRRGAVLLLMIVLVAAFALGTWAAGPVRGAMAASATSSEHDQFVADLDGVLQDGLDAGLIGLSVAIHREGQPPVSLAAGLANRETETPVTPSDRFRAYSV